MMSITDNLTVAGACIGQGELNIPEANGEELNVLAPKSQIWVSLFTLLS
jgi:hypothetical protein